MGRKMIKVDTEFMKLTRIYIPPKDFISSFTTIKEWLFHICESMTPPETSISDFLFVLYESTANDTLTIYGFSQFEENDVCGPQLDFMLPADMFMTLHQKDYTELSKKMLRERVKKEITEFINTSKFSNSFLAKTRTISFDSKGDIWSA